MAILTITQKDYDLIKIKKGERGYTTLEDFLDYGKEKFNLEEERIKGIFFENIQAKISDLIYLDNENKSICEIHITHCEIENIKLEGIKHLRIKKSKIGTVCAEEIKTIGLLNSTIFFLQLSESIVNITLSDTTNIGTLHLFCCIYKIFTDSPFCTLEKIHVENSYVTNICRNTSLLMKESKKITNCGNNLYPIVPETGSFIGYKKALSCITPGRHFPVIIKLEIQEDSLRNSACGRKCRASKVKVLDIYSIKDKNIKYEIAYSKFGLCSENSLKYEIGKIVEPNSFEEDRWIECAPGIHFFITEEEAINYDF